MRRIRYITVILMALLLFPLTGCMSEAERRAHGDALTRMERAAALMEEDPDSALSLLQTVDSAGLTDEPTQARFSLLMAQAIEKTSDITDMTVVQAARDYYTNHGTPTEKMIMYYHVGCVYKSQNDYLKALELFRQAEMFGKDSKDTLTLARTLVAEGTIYFKLEKWDEYLPVNQRAAALFLQIGDSARYYNVLLRVAVAYSRKGDWESQIKYLRKVRNEYPVLSDSLLKGLYYPELLLHYQKTGNKDSLQAAIDEYLVNVKDVTAYDSLDFVGSYSVMQLTSDARRYLPAETADTSFLYRARWVGTVAYLLEVEGDLKNAAIYQERFVAMEDSVKNLNVSQGVDMLNAKQTVENESHEKDSKLKNRGVFIILLIIAAVIAGILVVFFRRRSINDRQENRNKEKALAKALKQLEAMNKKLEDEKKRLEDGEKRLKDEKKRLKEYTDRRHNDRTYLNAYIEKFNKILIACQLKDGYYQDIAIETVNKIIESKKSFLHHAEHLYITKYPYNVDVLRSYNLTDQELNICFLVDLGMQSRHIAKFLCIGNIYNKTKEIREKLGLSNSRSNLKTWLSRDLTAIPKPESEQTDDHHCPPSATGELDGTASPAAE